jgi:hypothetical protein
MIGSLGRDRAEASGELRMAILPEPSPEDPERELVTIMPRRRDSSSDEEMTPPNAQLPLAPPPRVEPPPPMAVPPPMPASVPPRPPRAAAPVPRRITTGPSVGASIMLVLATLIAMGTAYVYCSKKRHQRTPDEPLAGGGAPVAKADAGAAISLAADAGAPPDAPRAVVAPVDAGELAVAIDAGAPADRVKAAKDLYDKAVAALDDGDAEQALQYADSSLKLRRTARTLLERARALQRLERIDEALASVDEALAIVSDYAPAYEQRALILWSARRYDDAKQAMRKYIALDPNGHSVDAFKNLLQEPL